MNLDYFFSESNKLLVEHIRVSWALRKQKNAIARSWMHIIMILNPAEVSRVLQ